jgi:two-component system sensor histidine kinase/response regulator
MKKILVIDDEEPLREMIHAALEQRGFAVAQAADGLAGIELARTELPDLVLCDVNMERMDGYHTLASLRGEPSTTAIPFILMTGMADAAGMRHGMELGADDYLAKPFTITELYAAVDARLRKAQVVREEAERKLADLRDNISLMLPHELRTPLNGILAYAEILTKDAATLQPTEISEMGQIIHESGQRLQRLIENFLIYTQIELAAADPQRAQSVRRKHTLKAAALIENHARKVAGAMGRAGQLVLTLADTPVAISEEYLAKIVEELVGNACKFSKSDTAVRLHSEVDGQRYVLNFCNQGRGFTTGQIQRIGAYMQFERKLHEQQGLGLGLAIAKRLAEVHGGTLAIQSQQGQDTIVTVSLPVAGSDGALTQKGTC